MSKELKVRLKEAMNERNIKVPQLSIETGIPKDRVYAWYRDDSKPKSEDAEILEKWINGENLTFNNIKSKEKTIEKYPIEQVIKEKDLALEALANMAASSRQQSEANNKQAESNKINAEKELILIKMLEQKSNLTADLERLAVVAASLDAFQEYVLNLIHEKYPEMQIEKMNAVLGNMTNERLESSLKMDIRKG